MADDQTTELTIPARYRGPDDRANGGFLAGRLASFLDSPHGTVVTLHAPSPVDVAMRTEQETDGIHLYDGNTLIASARPSDPFDALVPPVGFEVAELASAGYPGFTRHPAPECFVCGPNRPRSDGLRLFPGRLDDGTARTACPWVPDDSALDAATGHVPEEIVWAALDCPGGWTVDLESQPRVLGRITARIRNVPKPGDHCVVMGRALGSDGRKTYAATTIYAPDGNILGQSLATWLTLEA